MSISPLQNIHANLRRSARRLRARRTAAIGSPVLAASALLAIGLIAVPFNPLALVHPAGASAKPAPAPRHFDMLRPYAMFGWLPAHQSPVRDFLSRTEVDLYTYSTESRPPIALNVQAGGLCTVKRQMLRCRYGQYAILSNRIGREVGMVHGHPAYGSRIEHSVSPFALNWQYARGGWATLLAPDLHEALRIAGTVKFGSGTAIRFPFQLTAVPKDWHGYSLIADWHRRVEYASNYTVAAGRVTEGPIGLLPSTTPLFDAGPASKGDCAGLMYYKFVSRVINGYRVLVGSDEKYGWPESELCANDADGVFVWIAMGKHPTISAVNLFAHHMKLFGPNPAKWTTKPIK